MATNWIQRIKDLLGIPAVSVSADIAAVKGDTAAVLTDTADMQPKLGAPAVTVSADIAAVKGDTAAVLADTADMQPKLGAPAVTVSADIAAIKGETAAILADTGTDGVVVNSHTLPAKAEIQTEADDALVGEDLDHMLKTAHPTGIPVAATILDLLMNKDAGQTFARGSDSLEAIADAISAIAGVNTYQEQIPDTDFNLAAVSLAMATDPPSAPAANSVVDIDQVGGSTFVLRSIWINVTSFGTGTLLKFKLWTLVNAVVTKVDEVDVASLGIQNLADIFGLQEVHADGIWVTVQCDAGATGACAGTYRYAKAS